VPRHHGLEGGAEELVLVGGDHVALEGHAVRAPRLSRRARPVVETGWRGERELSLSLARSLSLLRWDAGIAPPAGRRGGAACGGGTDLPLKWLHDVPGVGENRPEGQAVQPTAPTPANSSLLPSVCQPPRQSLHVCAALAGSSNLPAGHCIHSSVPGFGCTDPGAQSVQVPVPSSRLRAPGLLYWPARHCKRARC
jgi:hypothetical protein